MKINFFLAKAIGTALFALYFFGSASAQGSGGSGNTLPPTKINWGVHEMLNNTLSNGEQVMCLKLHEENVLNVFFVVSTATDQLENHTPMFLEYFIMELGGIGDLVPITGQQMNYDIMLGVYTAKINALDFLSPICDEAGEGELPFLHSITIHYRLVRPHPTIPDFYTPYPMQNQVLWPSAIFGNLPEVDPMHSETKNVCCNQSTPRGLMVSNDDNLMDEAAAQSPDIAIPDGKTPMVQQGLTTNSDFYNEEKLYVFPNPFSDQTSVQFSVAEPGNIIFEMLDANGKVVMTSSSEVENAGSHIVKLDLPEVPKGMYYLRLSTNDWAKVVKLVKVEE